MPDYDVISKGEYNFPQSDPLLRTESYLFFRKDGNKFLLLKWFNAREDMLTGLDISLFLYDAAGKTVAVKRLPIGGLNAAGGAAFVLDYGIEVPEDCVECRVKINAARYGKYVYSPEKNGTDAEYVPEQPDALSAEPVRAEGISVSERRPAFPVWAWIVTFALFFCLMGLTVYDLTGYCRNANNFLINGVRYAFIGDKNTADSLAVIGCLNDVRHAVIEESVDGYNVTRISGRAFYKKQNLKSVTLKGELVIEEEAFYDCRALEEINFEEVTSVGSRAFYDCDSLRELRCERLTDIGPEAFISCSSLETVVIENDKDQLNIGSNAFANCANLKSVTIDQSVSSYGGDIFINCRVEYLRLKEMRYASINFLFGWSAYYLEEVHIGYMDGIPANAFSDMSSLKTVIIDELLEPVIGECAFENSGLETLKTPPIREVGAYAFRNSSIRSFDGTALESIGAGAFMYCNQLKEFRLTGNDVLTRIEDNVFYECRSLLSLNVPDSVEYIGLFALWECSSLSDLSLPFLGQSRDAENGRLTDIFGGMAVENLKSVTVRGGTHIAEAAFSNWISLEKIGLPDTVESVGGSAFAGCYRLTSIELPAGLVSVGDNAFSNCVRLGSITLPASLAVIGSNAFTGCYRLYEVVNQSRIDLSQPPAAVGNITEYALGVYDGDGEPVPKVYRYGYTFSRFGENWYLTGYPENEYRLDLPRLFSYSGEVIGSYRIPARLFFMETLSVISIPSGVSEIGEAAFMECANLEAVLFEDGSSLNALADEAFANCVSLEEFTVPEGVEIIGEKTFYYCNSMEKIVLSSELSAIGKDAFGNCEKLRDVYNLSDLPIEKGSLLYGGVARYAENVYTSLSDPQEAGQRHI